MMLMKGERYLGEFWAAGNPTEKRPGWIEIEDLRPIVTVLGQLTPAVAWKSGEDGFQSADFVELNEPERITVFGQLATGSERAVTVKEAVTISRKMNLFAITSGSNQDGMQVLQGMWAVHGKRHLDEDSKLTGAIVKVSGLEAWVNLSGLTGEAQTSVSPTQKVSYEKPVIEDITIPGGDSRLSIYFHQRPTQYVDGKLEIGHSAWIRFDDISCQSLGEIYGKYLAPSTQLVSLMLRRRCDLTEVRVTIDDDDYYSSLSHPIILPEAQIEPIKPGYGFLGLRDCGLEVFASWISMAERYHPVPNLVINQFKSSGSMQLESSVFQLAATAEGFDRRRVGELIMVAKGDARKARRVARAAIGDAVGEDVANRAVDFLGSFHESSYRERLDRLIELTESALPDVFGDKKEWKKHVVNARNGYAHLLEKLGNEIDIDMALLESLRWVMGAALLLEAGISPQKIREAASSNEDYNFFRTVLSAKAPTIYNS
jgi:ApeA-like protein/HEPN superfamily Apea-like protein